MNLLKKHLPRSLFGRTLLILILPTIVAQALAVYIFYERHWDNVSRHLAMSLAGEVVTVNEYIQAAKNSETEKKYLARSKNLFFFDPKLLSLPAVERKVKKLNEANFRFYNNKLKEDLEGLKFKVFSDHDKTITTVIYYKSSALVVDVPYKRLFNSSTYIFVIWMVGSTFILFLIAVAFLKNQIRPIIKLARVADNFGRGHDTRLIYKPEGAKEIRQAGSAFLKMQERLRRFIKQRTEMLAGISHDIRTPLTRMKLDIEMLKSKNPNLDFSGINNDIKDLENMITSYLEFVKKDEEEEAKETDIVALISEILGNYKTTELEILNKPLKSKIRPNAIKRVVKNLLDNAVKFGTKTKLSLLKYEDYILVIVDDNGTGIPHDKREDVFKPFYRVDSSRNSETGGVGLGLSIVRDIISHHGGTVHVEDSPLGGARLVVKLPA